MSNVILGSRVVKSGSYGSWIDTLKHRIKQTTTPGSKVSLSVKSDDEVEITVAVPGQPVLKRSVIYRGNGLLSIKGFPGVIPEQRFEVTELPTD